MAVFNGLAHTRACLESLRATTEPFRLVVADNGSSDGTRELLERFPYPYPLTAIRSVGEVGLRTPRDAQTYREIIGSMLEETDRLGRLVEGLLTLSRADGGNVSLRREGVDLAELAKESWILTPPDSWNYLVLSESFRCGRRGISSLRIMDRDLSEQDVVLCRPTRSLGSSVTARSGSTAGS